MIPNGGKPPILFYPATGRGLGLGHLYRGRMLLRTLAGPGSVIAIKPERDACAFLDSSKLPWQAVDDSLIHGSLGLKLAGIALEAGVRAVVLDCKDTSRELVLSLRQSGLIVVDLEDLGPGRHEADLLVDPHIQPSAEVAVYGGRAECCFGPSWALIDPIYASLRNTSAARNGGSPALKVAVSLGGSDPAGLTGRIIETLAGIDTELEIETVLGPAAENNQLPGAGRHTLRVHRDLPSLAGLLQHSDLAFVGGGITMFEALCLGAATVVVPQHDEQYRNASRLASHGALIATTPPSHAGADSTLADAAAAVCGDASLRSRLAGAAAALVDGAGVERLGRKINSLIGYKEQGKLAPGRR